MGCGNDAHIHLDRQMPTDPVKFAVGQHPQQTRLSFSRHIADLIEKQRATIGLFKAAAT